MKRFTTWGNYATVETTKGTYENVIVCPCPDSRNSHLLEYSNGDVIRIYTNYIKSITCEAYGKIYTTECN